MRVWRPLSQHFLQRLQERKWRRSIEVAIFGVPLIPLLLLALVSYHNLHEQLTDMAFSRRASLAHLSALTIKARLDTLLHIGTSLAERSRFYTFARQGDWAGAVNSLHRALLEFPEIDRIFLTNPQGIVMADLPAAVGAVGKDGSKKSWYLKVSKNWEPCLSDVYKRIVEPRYNVIATAIPLKDDAGKVYGILVMQTRIDKISEFSQWRQESDMGRQGFVYVVDREGNAVSHPKYSKAKDVVNLSQVPMVAEVLQGKKGVEMGYDPVEHEDRIAAYEPVENFGWGVIAAQPAREALGARDHVLHELWIVYGAAIGLSLGFSSLLVSGLRALGESEQRFRLTVEATKEWIWAIDVNWNILYSNPALQNLLGYTPEEMLGRSSLDLLTEEDRTRLVEEFIPLVLRQAEGWSGNLVHCRHKSGDLRTLESNAVAFFDSHGNLAGFRGASRDVTERQKVEEELKKARDMALELARAKSDFLAVMSHEIRTPMNGVIGMINLLADTELTDLQRDCVETVRHSGDTLLVVINDILNFSKIESGTMQLDHIPFNLRQCVEDTLDVFVGLIREKRIEVAYLIAPDVPTTLISDPARLRQILINLVGNALKFTSKGEIVINVGTAPGEGSGHRLLFSVTDSGIGIPPEAVHSIFESFHQVDSSTSRRYGGTGLGLAISKRLAEMMGGAMWVESELGAGSTFFFTILAEAAPSLGTVAIGAPAAILDPRRVLIVDDNATNRRILTQQLTTWGMLPSDVSSGLDALQRLREQTFDVVLVDLQMPGMDGLTLARAIREHHPVPLILLSSSSDLTAEETGSLFRFQITKPIKQSLLYDAILQATGLAVKRKAPRDKHFDGRTAERWPLRILLAEDNHVNQKVGLMTMAQLGYRADLAQDGFEVLDLLKNNHYDLILMDVQMPGMDGLEALARILANQPARRPFIVALTANALEGDREKMMAAGFDEYLSKPLQPDRLHEVLREAHLRASQPSPGL